MSASGESQIYRDLMRFKPEGLSPNAWAVKAGVSRTVWTDMRRHGNPSRRTLEKLLDAAGSSILEFEALRIGPEPQAETSGLGYLGDRRLGWGAAPLPPLPLVGSRLGGTWGDSNSEVGVTEIHRGELIERLARPPSLAGDSDAFALTIVADSMWPRFRPGARVAVSPRAPVAIGDEVLVRLRPAANATAQGVDRALIMHLVKRTASSFELRQFNPDRTVEVESARVDGVFKIVGELI